MEFTTYRIGLNYNDNLLFSPQDIEDAYGKFWGTNFEFLVDQLSQPHIF